MFVGWLIWNTTQKHIIAIKNWLVHVSTILLYIPPITKDSSSVVNYPRIPPCSIYGIWLLRTSGWPWPQHALMGESPADIVCRFPLNRATQGLYSNVYSNLERFWGIDYRYSNCLDIDSHFGYCMFREPHSGLTAWKMSWINPEDTRTSMQCIINIFLGNKSKGRYYSIDIFYIFIRYCKSYIYIYVKTENEDQHEKLQAMNPTTEYPARLR